MATNSNHLLLLLPELGDYYSHELHRENYQKIDAFAGRVNGYLEQSGRKTHVLFSGILTTGSANLILPDGFTSLDDFDEIIAMGTLCMPSVSTAKHFNQIINIKDNGNSFFLSESHEILYTTTTSDVYWLRATISKTNNTITISYNRKKIGANVGEETTDNAIAGIVGVKYG